MSLLLRYVDRPYAKRITRAYHVGVISRWSATWRILFNFFRWS